MRVFIVVCMILISGSGVYGTIGDVWDAALDFSNAAGDNPHVLDDPGDLREGQAVWSYLDGSGVLLPYTAPVPAMTTPGSAGWGAVPLIAGPAPLDSIVGPMIIDTDELISHGDTIIQWTSPVNGVVQISGSMGMPIPANQGLRLVRGRLLHNGAEISRLYNPQNPDGSQKTSLGSSHPNRLDLNAGSGGAGALILSVSVGDTIGFRLDGTPEDELPIPNTSGYRYVANPSWGAFDLRIMHVDEPMLPKKNLTMAVRVDGGAAGNPDTVSPSVGIHEYIEGQAAPISAATFKPCPIVLNFDHWEGDGIAEPYSANTSVLMDQDRTVTAVFADGRQCGDECHPVPSSDLIGDCRVNLDDLAVIIEHWLDLDSFTLDDWGMRIYSMYGKQLPAEGSIDMATRIDLKKSLELAGQHMLNVQEPELNYLGYWHVYANPTTYESTAEMTWTSHNLGRWWNAMPRLEEAIGFEIPAHIEAAMLENLQLYFDNPDNLLWTPVNLGVETRPAFVSNSNIGWQGPLYPLQIPTEKVLYDIEPHLFEFHSFRESVLSLNALVRYRNSDWARNKGHAQMETLLRIIGENGQWRDLVTLWYPTTVFNNYSPFPGVDNTVTNGRMLEAVVWFYQATGDASAMELATRLAQYHLANTTYPDGSLNLTSGSTHTHSYLNTLQGLLLYGELTGQQEYINRVALTYQNTVRGMIKKSGWMSHDMGTEAAGEVVSPGDVAMIALWLGTRHGYSEFMDDVERIIRARIIPSQITECPPLPPGAEVHYRKTNKLIIGAYGGMNGQPHAVKNPTTDADAADIHTLVDVYNHIAIRGAGGIRVHLHFDYEDENVLITSARSTSATVTIVPKVQDDVYVRIPRWTPPGSVSITVNGTPIAAAMVGDHAHISQSILPGEIILRYALPVSNEIETTHGVDYEIQWRGDEVIGIYPNDFFLPFYPTLADPSNP